MRLRDIYDDMPDGAAQRERNKRRLAELEREGDARRARIARAGAFAPGAWCAPVGWGRGLRRQH